MKRPPFSEVRQLKVDLTAKVLQARRDGTELHPKALAVLDALRFAVDGAESDDFQELIKWLRSSEH